MSGISELPFAAFMLMMMPIHLAIGIVEGLVTAGVLLFVNRAQPEILERTAAGRSLGGLSIKPVVTALLVGALVLGGAIAWFASGNPDGLEWSIERVAGTDEIEGATAAAHESAGAIQERTSFLPDYAFPAGQEEAGDGGEAWPAVDLGTTTAGVVGAGITLAAAALIGFALRRRSASGTAPSP
jgi:cobalt/nickel transport system permease protein